jgi:geranylgeranyl diphosphate synthase, type II
MNQHFGRRYERLRQKVDRRLAAMPVHGAPEELMQACRYVLTGGGKRLRAILVLLSAEAVGGTARLALDAAAAVEIMHNFTLVHDDVMDHAEARRGRPTVHMRWSLNTALLTGDTLLAVAYLSLLNTRRVTSCGMVRLFTRGVIDVCEGQALDMEYEKRENVTVRDYFAMIEKKTGRLISTATELGALVGGGTAAEARALRRFGHYLGRAFQLQDDLLDVFGNEEELGKTIGGDIVEGKRTFLLLKALERARGKDRLLLQRVARRNTGRGRPSTPRARQALVSRIRSLYAAYGVIDETHRLVQQNTHRALAVLSTLAASPARDMLAWLSNKLVDRAS